MEIRDAGDGDISAIAEIYNDSVAHTTAIWNDTLVDVANRSDWLANRRRAGYPVLVAVDARAPFLLCGLGIEIVTVLILLYFFKRRGWIGGPTA